MAKKQRGVKPHQKAEYLHTLEVIQEVSDGIIDEQKKRIEQQKADHQVNTDYLKSQNRETQQALAREQDSHNKTRNQLRDAQVETQRQATKTQRVVEERDRLYRVIEMFTSVQIIAHPTQGDGSGYVTSETRKLRDQHFKAAA